MSKVIFDKRRIAVASVGKFRRQWLVGRNYTGRRRRAGKSFPSTRAWRSGTAIYGLAQGPLQLVAGLTRSSCPNEISIGSAVFAQHTDTSSMQCAQAMRPSDQRALGHAEALCPRDSRA